MKAEDGKALTESQKVAEEAQQKIRTTNAAQNAKKAGKLPGELREFLDELLEPKIDWREILARFIGDMSREDMTWRRPNPRYSAASGLYLPSLDGKSFGRVALAVDTSGSISSAEFTELVSEAMGCVDEYDESGTPKEIEVFYCDTKVHHRETLSPGDTPFQHAKGGGGGTKYSPVMHEVSMGNVEEDTQALVYMTDGYCSDFGTDPGIPVLWVLTQTNKTFNPPFGEVVKYEKE